LFFFVSFDFLKVKKNKKLKTKPFSFLGSFGGRQGQGMYNHTVVFGGVGAVPKSVPGWHRRCDLAFGRAWPGLCRWAIYRCPDGASELAKRFIRHTV
jgi:hypothetical protein